MKNPVLIVASLLLFGCKGGDFLKMSNQLGTKQGDRVGKVKTERFSQVRSKMYKQIGESFLKGRWDTLYILERFDMETGSYFSELWNKTYNFSYKYEDKMFSFSNDNYFIKCTKDLVVAWDTSQIRLLEQNNRLQHPANRIYASKAIRIKGGFLINTIDFDAFVGNLYTGECK